MDNSIKIGGVKFYISRDYSAKDGKLYYKNSKKPESIRCVKNVGKYKIYADRSIGALATTVYFIYTPKNILLTSNGYNYSMLDKIIEGLKELGDKEIL